jgi:hypothetical protein
MPEGHWPELPQVIAVDGQLGTYRLIPATHAGVVFSGAPPMLPYFVNRAAAAGLHASFDVRLRDKNSPRCGWPSMTAP